MKVFWHEKPLDEEQRMLMEACRRAHAATANRQNASTGALINAAHASRNYVQSIASAMMTLGEVHAPVPRAYRLLASTNPVAVARAILDRGQKVPGWGNAFHKDGIDPEWEQVAGLVRIYWPHLHEAIDAVTYVLHEGGKVLYPNAACYTAAVALATGLPADACLYLVLAGRLPVWSAIFLSTINPQLTT